MMRPQLACRIAGRHSRARRTPLSTLTSKKRVQSASGMSSKALGSKMPRLLTRISMPGYCATRASAAAAVLRSPAKPSTAPPGAAGMRATAASTEAWARPLTITRAPSAASAVAMARPMPAVLPETRASLPLSCRFMGIPFEQLDAGERMARVPNPCSIMPCGSPGDDPFGPGHDHAARWPASSHGTIETRPMQARTTAETPPHHHPWVCHYRQ